MAEPFLAEIRLFSFSFAPNGWATCNGQLLPINQNQALFSLLGTTFGGNGQTNFALPDLRARVPLHDGSGHTLGERGGEESHTIVAAEAPAHTHLVQASRSPGDAVAPAGNVLASPLNQTFRAPDAPVNLDQGSVTAAGGSQPHENRQPFLTLSFCIALVGIFPSQN
jgi:microcystin-dependent protein